MIFCMVFHFCSLPFVALLCSVFLLWFLLCFAFFWLVLPFPVCFLAFDFSIDIQRFPVLACHYKFNSPLKSSTHHQLKI